MDGNTVEETDANSSDREVEQVDELSRFSIWDSHAHILPENRTRGLVRWIKKAFPEHPSHEDWNCEEILSGLTECGVEKVFNLVFPLEERETEMLNAFSRDIGEKYEYVVPFGSMHIETPRKEAVAERCLVEYGLAGIKLHPYVQGFEAFSGPFEPLFKTLNRLQKPLLVHTGFDVFYSRMQDLDYLSGVLERYPGMPVVLVHALFPRFGLARKLVELYPQVYLDMTNVLSSIRYLGDWPLSDLEGHIDTESIRKNLDYFYQLIEENSSRIMFGTDHPAGMGSPEQIYHDLESFGFDVEIKKNLLGETARVFYERHCV